MSTFSVVKYLVLPSHNIVARKRKRRGQRKTREFTLFKSAMASSSAKMNERGGWGTELRGGFCLNTTSEYKLVYQNLLRGGEYRDSMESTFDLFLIPFFSPLDPPAFIEQPFLLPNMRIEYTVQVEPRYEELARVGRDSAIEVLFQKCLSGNSGRSRGEISAEIAAKKEQFTCLGDMDEDDDMANEANEEKRRQLRKEITALREELKNCGTTADTVPFPFSPVTNTGEFTRKMGLDILASLKASWEALCDERKPSRSTVPDAHKYLQAIEELAATQADLLWDQLRTVLNPMTHQKSKQTAQFAGLHPPVVPNLVLASLLDSEVPPPVKQLIISFAVSCEVNMATFFLPIFST
jgi:hypothetical protein